MSPLLLGLGVALAGPPVGEGWWDVSGGDPRAAGLVPVEGRREEGGVVLQRVLLPPGFQRGEGTALPPPLRHVRADHSSGAPPAAYRVVGEGGELLRELAEASTRAGHAVLGRSVDGLAIEALWIGQAPGSGAPVHRVLGAHHGDEGSSFEVALAVAEALVGGDGTDPRVTRILDASTVWIVPYVNPDGVLEGRRFNANGIDLNRNYDFAWSAAEPFGGPHPFSEPETRAMRAFGHHVRPFLGLSLHSGATNLGWVWNHTVAPVSEDLQLRALASAYADRCDTPGFYVTNGAQWYVSHGDTNDWSFGRYGVMDFTLELTDPRTPLPSQIPTFVAEHLDAVLGLLDREPNVAGEVRDEAGRPVEARLRVVGEQATAWFTSDPATGRFHRLVHADALEGAELRVEAWGYASATVALPALGEGAPALEVTLTATDRGSGVAEPWVLGEAGTVLLPGAPDGEVVLRRLGADAVVVEARGGRVMLDPAELVPGPWSVVGPDGTAYPGALWVEGREGVSVSGLERNGASVVVRGAGLAAGAQAWAYEDGVPTPLPTSSSAGRVEIGVGGVDAARLDLALWVAGAQLGFADVREGTTPGTTPGDTGSPVDTGPLGDGSADRAPDRGCGCQSPARPLGGFGTAGLILATTLIAFRRRRSCSP